MAQSDRNHLPSQIHMSISALRVFGLWNDSEGLNYWLYTFYSASVIFCLVAVTVAHTIQMPFVLSDIKRAAVCAYVVMGSSAIVSKVCSFVYMRNHVDILLSSLPVGGEGGEDILEGARRRSKVVFIAFQAIAHSALLGWLALPPLGAYLSPPALNDTETETRLPLDAWYPFDTTSSPNYEIMFAFQTLSVYFCGVTINSVDIFQVTVIMYVAAQLEILKVNISGIGKKPKAAITDLKPGIGDEIEPNNESMSEEMHEKLSIAVKNHQRLIWSVDRIQMIIGPSVFFQFILNLFDICLTAFVVVVVPADVVSLGKFSTNLIWLMFQNFLYCWFGNRIIEHSENLLIAAYSCGWPDCNDERFKRSLRILMLRAQHPLKLKVGKLYTLSRETFLTLLNGSYSFFTVLYQMKSSSTDKDHSSP